MATIEVKLLCSGNARCTGSLRITVTRLPNCAIIARAPAKHRGHRKRPRRCGGLITLGHVAFSIPPGKTTAVKVKLTLGGSLASRARPVTIRVLAAGARKPITRKSTLA